MERGPFSAKNRYFKILQSMYFTYNVGIISSYSKRRVLETSSALIQKKSIGDIISCIGVRADTFLEVQRVFCLNFPSIVRKIFMRKVFSL